MADDFDVDDLLEAPYKKPVSIAHNVETCTLGI